MRPVNWLRFQADRVIGATLLVAGALAVIIGWAKASKVILPAEQIPYVISGGLFGLVLVAAGVAVWLSADMRDEWRALRRIEDQLAALRALQERSAAAGPDLVEREDDGDPAAARNGAHAGVAGPR